MPRRCSLLTSMSRMIDVGGSGGLRLPDWQAGKTVVGWRWVKALSEWWKWWCVWVFGFVCILGGGGGRSSADGHHGVFVKMTSSCSIVTGSLLHLLSSSPASPAPYTLSICVSLSTTVLPTRSIFLNEPLVPFKCHLNQTFKSKEKSEYIFF